MPIYSSNRTGSMIESAVKGYTCNDFGRIMYESQLNDMAFFEAALNCDFNEIKGLREGTILEAEVKKLNMDSIKGLIGRTKERLQKFMGKVIAAIRDAIDRIALYVTTDGKKFVEKFNKNVKDRIGSIDNWKGKVLNVELWNTNDSIFDVSDIKTEKIESDTNKDSGLGDAFSTEKLTKELLGFTSYDEYKKNLNTYKHTVDITSKNVESLKNTVSSAKGQIKDLKDLEKKVRDKVNEVIKKLDKKDKSETNKNYINFVNNYTSTFEKCVTIKAKANINCIRFNVRSSRAALQKVLKEVIGDTKNESAGIDGLLEFDYIMSSHNPINESNAQAVRAVIEAATC